MTDEHLAPEAANPQADPPAAAPPAVPPVTGYAAAPAAAHTQPHPRSHGGTMTAVLIASVIAFVVAVVSGLAGGYLASRYVMDSSGGRTAGGGLAKVRVIPSETSEPVIAAAAAAVPSVVNVDVSTGVASGGQSGLPNAHPGVPMSGTGSGVAFKRAPGGGTYILTNDHVVDGAKTLTVRDSSGDSFKAELVGTDAETDIAVIKVDRDIPLIDIADSSELAVGQTVVAIGSPFGLEHSVTSGVISATGRSLPDFSDTSVYPLVDVIQTDAAINPGNSGGALVERTGKLVGINSAIYTETGANGGIGFAIPSNTAVRIAEELIAGGDAKHPYLGILGQTVNAQLKTEKKLSVDEGAYIEEVTAGTGAQKAGVKAGDVVVALEGARIRTMDDLILQVRRKRVGETVTLDIVRGEKRLSIDVLLGDKPSDLDSKREDEPLTIPLPDMTP